ncbi:MAG TPA: hypothetical protein VGH28_33810 [Polyangiaceae bacterium]
MRVAKVCALGILLSGACSVPDVSYEGKTCTDTCPASLTCVDGACRQIDSLVYVTDFHVAWATPSSVRWAWTLEGDGTNLVSYSLAVTSPVAGAPGAKTWTSADNEELGGYQIKQSSGYDIVTGTITSEMQPATEYDAVLTVTDVDGHTFQTGSVRAETDSPRTRELVDFDGVLPNGAITIPLAPAFSIAPDGGVDGGPSLFFPVPPGTDFENLREAGLGLRIDGLGLSDKLFATAYLELFIRGIGTPASTWSEVWIRLYNPDGSSCTDFSTCIYHFATQWLYHPDPQPPGVYRRVQIPLAQFQLDDGTPLSLAALGLGIDEINVGCPFGATDTSTNLDQIAIWW